MNNLVLSILIFRYFYEKIKSKTMKISKDLYSKIKFADFILPER